MTLASQYAKALYAAGGDKKHLEGLKTALLRRGHGKLLPKIYEEYQKLMLHDERLTLHKRQSPKKERTRVLLELYRKLIEAK